MTTLIRDFSLALVLLSSLGAAPLAQSQQIHRAVLDDELARGFAQLTVGMPDHEVLAIMKKEPSRKEFSNHLGLEITRLVWTQWSTGSTFQVVLVAGRLVSTAAAKKSWVA